MLQGARNSIERHLPLVWIECWKVGVDEIRAQFAGLEYEFYTMDHLNMLCAPANKLTQLNIVVAGTGA